MHKKLESELMSIAHNILQMKNKNDVVALKNKAQELYERLSVLAFVDEYLQTTPNATETKEELIEQIEKHSDESALDSVEVLDTTTELEVQGSNSGAEQSTLEALEEPVEDVVDEPMDKLAKESVEDVVVEKAVNEIVDEVVEEVQEHKEQDLVDAVSEEHKKKQLSLEEEFKDAISVDVTADLFQKAPVKSPKGKPTLNDTLLKKNIQVGLNDRIAFVKHLFNHSQADFNRVLSQLNSIETEKEAKAFISKMVKPDYDWTGKEEYETRLMDLIERRF